MDKFTQFIGKHWKIVLVVVLSLGIVGIVWAVTASGVYFPSAEEIQAWSIQESIFYGLSLVAFVLFVSR